MKVQLTLTPAEGKRLIAQAIASKEEVQNAYKNGILIIATSTTTAYIAEELMGKALDKGMFTAGVVTHEGLGITIADDRYPHYAFEKGELKECSTPELVPFLAKMGPDDVFIKGVNAIDPYGAAGVLVHGPGGGTVGTAYGYLVRNGAQIILPAGLEKFVPVDLTEIVPLMGVNAIDKAMGWPCGMMLIQGLIFTEIDAFKQLFDVEAIPVAGGGIDGAEGSKIFIIECDKEAAEAAYACVVGLKGENPLKTKTMGKPAHLA